MSSVKDIKLLESQSRVFKKIKAFITSSPDRIFILKGYAGTGKTTLMRFLIDFLQKKKRLFKLLASTGRAAKILSDVTNFSGEVSTIHRLIYKYEGLNKDLSDVDTEQIMDEYGQLYLNFGAAEVDLAFTPETIYIVDEASMVSDVPDTYVTQAKFGSGKLLTDLLEYDKRDGSKFIFVGDPCQLPPFTEYFSPALSVDYFKKTFGLNAQKAELTEIVRMADATSLIKVSNQIRSMYSSAPEDKKEYGTNKVWGKLPLGRCKDIQLHCSSDEMVEDYLEKIQGREYERATFICKSNAKCKKISEKVRKALKFTGLICPGDLLLVIQNNYATGLMNGDMVEVQEVSSMTKKISELTFRQVKVKELFSGLTYSTLLIDEILVQDHLNLNVDQQTRLFINFIIRMKEKGITQKDELRFRTAVQNDPYLNALRCVYGYAITCHKAQGGEWDEVYVDFPRNITLNPTKEEYQWVYTAITRTKKRLHVINDFFID